MELCVKKVSNALMPVRDQDGEWLSKAGNEDHYLANIKKVRNPKFFRKYWAMLNFAFDHWEPELKQCKYGVPEKNIERFRKDLTILAGYYDVVYKITGEAILTAKSIAWANMEELEFEKFYLATFNAISKHIFSNYSPEQLKEIEKALEKF